MKSIFLFISITVLSVLISGCAQNVSPNTYNASEVGVASKVVPGIIIAKRIVNIDANSGAGGLAGVAAGAAAGSTIGGDAATNIVGAVGGAVVGGVVGNALDKMANRHQGVEYIIKLKNGSTVSIVQAEDIKFEVNQRVLIIYGSMTRIIPNTISGESNGRR